MLSSIFTVGFLVSLLAGTIRLATPILLPALGQIYTQRAGILNLGVEANNDDRSRRRLFSSI